MTKLLIVFGFLGMIVLVSLIARARYRREVAQDRAVRERLGVPAPKSSTSAGGAGHAYPFDGPSGDAGGCD